VLDSFSDGCFLPVLNDLSLSDAEITGITTISFLVFDAVFVDCFLFLCISDEVEALK
jgi:hypothetical protein